MWTGEQLSFAQTRETIHTVHNSFYEIYLTITEQYNEYTR